jgi:hypothetical protein
VDSLFFADDYATRLPHEYQFNLNTDAARLALERAQIFSRLAALTVAEPFRRGAAAYAMC